MGIVFFFLRTRTSDTDPSLVFFCIVGCVFYKTVNAQVDPAIGEAGDIDTSLVMLTFENGVVATVDNSRKATYGYDQRVEVFGSKVQCIAHDFRLLRLLLPWSGVLPAWMRD